MTRLYEPARKLANLLQDILVDADALYELSLERRGPLNDDERNRARTAAHDLVRDIRKLSVIAEEVKREANKL